MQTGATARLFGGKTSRGDGGDLHRNGRDGRFAGGNASFSDRAKVGGSHRIYEKDWISGGRSGGWPRGDCGTRPDLDLTIWRDGPLLEGFRNRGGGALDFHLLDLNH